MVPRRFLVAAAGGVVAGLVAVGSSGRSCVDGPTRLASGTARRLDIRPDRHLERGQAGRGGGRARGRSQRQRPPRRGGGGRRLGRAASRLARRAHFRGRARQVIVSQAEAFRGGWATRRALARRSSGGTSTEVSGLRLEWRDVEGGAESVQAKDIQLEREGGRTRLAAKQATVAFGAATVSVVDGALELVRREDGGYRVAELAARELDAELRLPPPAVAGDGGGAAEADPDEPPLPPMPAPRARPGDRRSPPGRHPASRPRAATDPAPSPASGPATPTSPGRGEAIRRILVEAREGDRRHARARRAGRARGRSGAGATW